MYGENYLAFIISLPTSWKPLAHVKNEFCKLISRTRYKININTGHGFPDINCFESVLEYLRSFTWFSLFESKTDHWNPLYSCSRYDVKTFFFFLNKNFFLMSRLAEYYRISKRFYSHRSERCVNRYMDTLPQRSRKKLFDPLQVHKKRYFNAQNTRAM